MHDMSNARAMHDPDMFKVSHCIRQAEEQREGQAPPGEIFREPAGFDAWWYIHRVKNIE